MGFKKNSPGHIAGNCCCPPKICECLDAELGCWKIEFFGLIDDCEWFNSDVTKDWYALRIDNPADYQLGSNFYYGVDLDDICFWICEPFCEVTGGFGAAIYGCPETTVRLVVAIFSHNDDIYVRVELRTSVFGNDQVAIWEKSWDAIPNCDDFNQEELTARTHFALEADSEYCDHLDSTCLITAVAEDDIICEDGCQCDCAVCKKDSIPLRMQVDLDGLLDNPAPPNGCECTDANQSYLINRGFNSDFCSGVGGTGTGPPGAGCAVTVRWSMGGPGADDHHITVTATGTRIFGGVTYVATWRIEFDRCDLDCHDIVDLELPLISEVGNQCGTGNNPTCHVTAIYV